MFRILDLQIYFIYCNPVICHLKETKTSFASKICDLMNGYPNINPVHQMNPSPLEALILN